jgi:hypothetical protein
MSSSREKDRRVASLLEKLETLREIYLAEQQISSGQGVPHELAREQILSALKR